MRRIDRWAPLKMVTRFWLKVYARGDCWEWRGFRNSDGYGQFTLGEDRLQAHRIAFTEAYGSIPGGLQIDHLCQHPWCVRPSHLDAVVQRTNILRGNNNAAARHARQTACINGHPFNEENTWRPRDGSRRYCKVCLREAQRRYRRKKVA